MRGLTLHYQSAQSSTSHPGAGSIGSTHIHSRVLQGHVRDHQVSRAQNLDTFHTYGSPIWKHTQNCQLRGPLTHRMPKKQNWSTKAFLISLTETVSNLTQSAPRHDGLGISSGNTLQNGCLMDSDGEVLGARQDDWLLVKAWGSSWQKMV